MQGAVPTMHPSRNSETWRLEGAGGRAGFSPAVFGLSKSPTTTAAPNTSHGLQAEPLLAPKAVLVQVFVHGVVRGWLALALGHVCAWTLSSSSAGGSFTAPAACPCAALRLLRFPVKSQHPLPVLAWVAGTV